MNKSHNIDLVLKHLEGFADIESYIDKIAETAAEDIEWVNSGFAPYHGLEQARQSLRGLGQKFRGIRIENLHVSEDGDKVWTERIDYMLDKDGNTVLTLPCMGIFEIENGRIKSWRDYFDATPLKS
jgi:limonene-1,2-epoxide hydrolase